MWETLPQLRRWLVGYLAAHGARAWGPDVTMREHDDIPQDAVEASVPSAGNINDGGTTGVLLGEISMRGLALYTNSGRQ